MANQAQRNCPTCGRPTLHVKQQSIGDGFGCLLSVLTCGLFLLLWLPLILIDGVAQPWRCQVCGREN